VEFRGWVDRESLKREFAQCSLLVFPSVVPETFGMVGPEAMAYGRPVVAFDVGAVREWLIDGVNGLMVRRGDTQGFADAINSLLTDLDLTARLGRAARESVIERFSPAVGVSQLLECYREVVRQ
jgi:glycosyltransferase involved in cell wall biosynthesis